jgi:hypothetical protein
VYLICYSVRELLTFLEGEHDAYKKIQVKVARRTTVALKRAAKTIGEVAEQVIKQLSTHERHACKGGTPLIFCHFEKYFIILATVLDKDLDPDGLSEDVDQEGSSCCASEYEGEYLTNMVALRS